ncbi:MAG: zinc finger domain-containing protein [Candidatus Thorarchaeota archaeon]
MGPRNTNKILYSGDTLSTLKAIRCTSCHGSVSPQEHSVKMACPNCGGFTIWRCESCRRFSNRYTCPNCGFEGP